MCFIKLHITAQSSPVIYSFYVCVFVFFFISLIADGPHHYHPACGHNACNFTYSRSHAFRYGGKNTNPALTRIELTTSALAGVQVTY